jgi:ribose transport system substrate-binding protein
LKKITVLAMAVLLVAGITFVGCTRQASTAPSAEAGSAQKHYTVGFTNMDLTTTTGQFLSKLFRQAVESRGDTFMETDGQLDQSKQNNGIEDMITRGIDILFLQPVDSQSALPALRACKEAGVKVIVYDSAVNNPELTESFIAPDNREAGRLTGLEMVRIYPNGARVALIENPLAESVVSRVQGFEEGIKGSNVQIVDRKGITRYEQVLGTAEDMIQAHPDLNAFWALNDPVALIVLGAVQSAGLQKQINIFAVDGSPEGKKSISQGGIYGSAVQSNKNMAAKTVEVAYKVLAGEKVDPVYLVETYLATPDNIKDYNIDEWE